MIRTTLTILLLAGVVGVGVLVAGGASTSYEEATTVVTKGGGTAAANDRELVAGIGETAIGTSKSPGYECETGMIPAQGSEDRILWACGQPDPVVIGATGTTALRWAAAADGDYEVFVNGASLGTGTFTTDGIVTIDLLSADLPADDFAEIKVQGTSGPESQGVTFRVFNDRTAPVFKDMGIATVTAQVDRSTAAPGTQTVAITVPGVVAVPHFLNPGGGFEYTLPAPGKELVIEVVNKLGRLVRRDLELMTGDPPAPPGPTLFGRTVLWPTPEGEAEVDFTVVTEDEKGKLTGFGTLRLPGDPTVYDLEVLKGKLSKKAKAKGHKLKVTLKGSTPTKAKVSVKGYWINGVVTGAKISVSVKKVFKDKWKEVTFTPLEDNGSPIRVATVVVAGTAEDSRDGAMVTVRTGDGDFGGANPVAFTESLSSVSDLASTLAADDDAAPANRREHSIYTEVRW